MRKLVRRPSPATAIASLALFVSLSGVSYGVATGFIDSREIKDNTILSRDVKNSTVRTQDLRNNEIRGGDIRNSTITGRDVALNALGGQDIDESKLDIVESGLGKVGDANTLDGVDSSGFLRPDGTGFQPIPDGIAGEPAPGEPAPQFDVDPFGYVHLEGVVLADGSTQPWAVLPLGVRPAATKRFVVYRNDGAPPPAAGFITVEPSGEIRGVEPVDVNDQFSLDGVTFRAAG